VYWSPGHPDAAANWERAIDEEGTVVHASLRDGSLELNLAPAISVYSQHHGKRLAASVYFEIAAKYAEKVGGTIIQRATVAGCKAGSQPQELVLGDYPAFPMSFDRICAGFRAVLLAPADSAGADGPSSIDPLHHPYHAEGPPARDESQHGLWRPRNTTAPGGVFCPECGASFPQETQLQSHQTSVHRR